MVATSSTGAKDFAQNFANIMEVNVLAPSDTVWAFLSGELTIGPKSYINNGHWINIKRNAWNIPKNIVVDPENIEVI